VRARRLLRLAPGVHEANKLVTTPCYMNDVGPWTVSQGAEKMVEEVLRLTGAVASMVRQHMRSEGPTSSQHAKPARVLDAPSRSSTYGTRVWSRGRRRGSGRSD